MRNRQKLCQRDELQVEIVKTYETVLDTYTNVLMKRHVGLRLQDICRVVSALSRRRPINAELFQTLGDFVVRDFDRLEREDYQFKQSAFLLVVVLFFTSVLESDTVRYVCVQWFGRCNVLYFRQLKT